MEATAEEKRDFQEKIRQKLNPKPDHLDDFIEVNKTFNQEVTHGPGHDPAWQKKNFIIGWCRDKLDYLGGGDFRKCYKLNDEWVVKVVSSSRNGIQNRDDWEFGQKYDIVPDCFGICDYDTWIIQRSAKQYVGGYQDDEDVEYEIYRQIPCLEGFEEDLSRSNISFKAFNRLTGLIDVFIWRYYDKYDTSFSSFDAMISSAFSRHRLERVEQIDTEIYEAIYRQAGEYKLFQDVEEMFFEEGFDPYELRASNVGFVDHQFRIIDSAIIDQSGTFHKRIEKGIF